MTKSQSILGSTQILPAKRRICFFAGFNADGIIHEYVVYYISQLADICDVHYLADCEMGDGQLEKLAPYVKSARGYRHEKYDFGSWQELASQMGWSSIETYDELILCNDSCYGPLSPLSRLFETMESKDIDFWGMTESSELLTRHLQSYFLVFRNNVIRSGILKQFFSGVRKQQIFWNYVVKYEIFITQMLVNAGFKFEAYLKTKSAINATTFPMTIVGGFNFPFIKIKSFTNPETNLNEPIDGLELLLQAETSYDTSLIRAHLDATAPNYKARINQRFAGAPVIPMPTKPEKILVHLHLGHPEEVPYFISRLVNICSDFDLYVTTTRIDELTENLCKSFDNGATIIELPYAGNDVIAFLHVINLVSLDDYDHVLKLHSMGIIFEHKNLLGANLYAYGWRNALVEPLLESEPAFRRHLTELSANRGTGMIASSLLLSCTMRETSADKQLLAETWTQQMRLKLRHDPAPLVAGRMFLMRAALCTPLCFLDLPGIERDFKEGRLAGVTIEHVMEKIFALLLDHGNATLPDAVVQMPLENYARLTKQVADTEPPGNRFRCYLQHRYLKAGKHLGIFTKAQYKSMKLTLRQLL